MTRARALAAFLILLSLVTAIDAPPATAQEDTVQLLVPAENAPATARTLAAAPADTGWVRVEVPVEGDVEITLARARANYGPDAHVERVYELLAPHDEELFGQQWALENTGQTGGKVDADIDATTAWGVSLGEGIVVAVIDSGVDASHPDLAGGVIQGWDTVGDGLGDADPSPDAFDPEGDHGTLVAGVIAARDNGVGIAGVAPAASILNMRACAGGSCRSLDIAEAIYRAVDLGAHIVNLSLGSAGDEDPPLQAAINYARARNVLVVTAAGNDGLNIDTQLGGDIIIPAALPIANILAVGGSNHHDTRPSWSNYGQSVDLLATGDAILTTGLDSPYAVVSGSSFAAPTAAGVAALLLSHDPGISYHELKARMMAFTDRPASLNGLSASGRVNAGTLLTRRFVDTASSVFVNAIDWMADRNITEGCDPPSNVRYCPTREVTRGEMAVFFARAFHLPPTGSDFFNDDAGTFYEASANRMAAAGITVGCGPQRYCGNRNITRGEMAAMLARVLRLPASSVNRFVDDNGHLFEGAINRIAAAGVTQGCNPPVNNRYCPDDNVTRGEMSAFIKRAVERGAG